MKRKKMYNFSLKAELLEKPSFVVKSSIDVAKYLKEEIFNNDTINYTEECHAILLNRANYVIGDFLISKGGTTASILDVKLICMNSLLAGAHGVILSHNHPSGSDEVSNSDIKSTEGIKNGLKLLDILLLDHIILTNDTHVSFMEEGYL